MTAPITNLPDSEERQVASTLDGIRKDHTNRYHWLVGQLHRHHAAHITGATVVDLGCGVGYGAFLLAMAKHSVLAVDRDDATLEYARKHWAMHAGIGSTNFQKLDLSDPKCNAALTPKDVAVAFEIIEHLEDPLPLLLGLKAGVLYASVPNEEVFPWANYKFHFRHYTKAQFAGLLAAAGWQVTRWWGQDDEEGAVERDVNGRTLIAVCERSSPPRTLARELPNSATTDALEDAAFSRALDDVYDGLAEKAVGVHTPTPAAQALANDVEPYRHPTVVEPKAVMLCGLGPSKYELIELMVQHDFEPSWDELWTVNKGLSILPNADVTFIMDDVVDYATKHPAYGKEMLSYSGEIIGQTVFPAEVDSMGLNFTDYPLKEVLEFWGGNASNWLHTISIGYIMAYAGAIGVKRLMLAGIDCSWPNRPDLTEAGNAVVCYWIGRLEGIGCEVIINSQSVLNATSQRDRYEWRKFYGYLRQPAE